jgi:DNA-binding transcriptional LysR family regulator
LRGGGGAMLLPKAMAALDLGLEAVPGFEVPAFELEVWLVTHSALQRVPRVRVVMGWLASVMAGPGEPPSLG